MSAMARVSTKRGKWSVAVAVATPVLWWLVGTVLLIGLMPSGGSATDPDYIASATVAGIVVSLVAVVMAIGAMVLGITSLVGAWPQRGRPGRTTALALGWVGVALGALVGLLIVSFVRYF